jgi:hypothetical protein
MPPDRRTEALQSVVEARRIARHKLRGGSILVHHESQAQASSQEGEVQSLRDNLEGEVFVGKAFPY